MRCAINLLQSNVIRNHAMWCRLICDGNDTNININIRAFDCVSSCLANRNALGRHDDDDDETENEMYIHAYSGFNKPLLSLSCVSVIPGHYYDFSANRCFFCLSFAISLFRCL